MQRISITSFFLFCSLVAISQPLRYKDIVFKKVIISKNIPYRPTEKSTVRNLLDLYQPAHDESEKRPLIIWIHGGGFKNGKKTARGIPIWSKTFAQRGYVCAAVNYRLSDKKPLSRFPDLVEGCYEAIKDVEMVAAYFRKNQLLYGIDTNRIILAGNSAGGMVALQAVYSSEDALGSLFDSTRSSNRSKQINPMKIAGIINFWGAVFDSTWLRNTRIPIVSVQGTGDRVVPFDNKKLLFGTAVIHRQADRLHIPNELKAFKGYGHELQKHFNPLWAGAAAKRRWREAGQFAADFLFLALFK